MTLQPKKPKQNKKKNKTKQNTTKTNRIGELELVDAKLDCGF